MNNESVTFCKEYWLLMVMEAAINLDISGNSSVVRTMSELIVQPVAIKVTGLLMFFFLNTTS